MIRVHVPKYSELWFRKQMLADSKTMSYNQKWGGTIDFDESKWDGWFEKWLKCNKQDRLYRYLVNDDGLFVGEVAYYLFEGKYQISIIIYHKYRRLGYGKQALDLICEIAKDNGIEGVYDSIGVDNYALKMFLDAGFVEENSNSEAVIVKKKL